jgi:hypothetical protein
MTYGLSEQLGLVPVGPHQGNTQRPKGVLIAAALNLPDVSL